MLDLGVWMSIQCAVERAQRGRRCHRAALVVSVEEAWRNYLNQKAFSRVHARLRVVLRCILDDNGGNDRVEQKRGKLFRDCTLIDLTLDNEEDNEDITTEINLTEDVEIDDELSVSSL